MIPGCPKTVESRTRSTACARFWRPNSESRRVAGAPRIIPCLVGVKETEAVTRCAGLPATLAGEHRCDNDQRDGYGQDSQGKSTREGPAARLGLMTRRQEDEDRLRRKHPGALGIGDRDPPRLRNRCRDRWLRRHLEVRGLLRGRRRRSNRWGMKVRLEIEPAGTAVAESRDAADSAPRAGHRGDQIVISAGPAATTSRRDTATGPRPSIEATRPRARSRSIGAPGRACHDRSSSSQSREPWSTLSKVGRGLGGPETAPWKMTRLPVYQ